MNKYIKTTRLFFKSLATDRTLLIVCTIMLVLSLIFAIQVSLAIRPNDLQLVSRYSAFGSTHLYRDQWFYQLLFPIFILTVAIVHIAISKKTLETINRHMALLFAWLGLGLVIFAWVTANTVLTVWSPL